MRAARGMHAVCAGHKLLQHHRNNHLQPAGKLRLLMCTSAPCVAFGRMSGLSYCSRPADGSANAWHCGDDLVVVHEEAHC